MPNFVYADPIRTIAGFPSDHNDTIQATVASTVSLGFKYEWNGVGHGTASLSGTVTVKGIVVAGAIVLLFDEATAAYVNSTVSDSSGIYTFTGLPNDRDFFMVFKEPTGLWEYRVSSRRTPA